MSLLSFEEALSRILADARVTEAENVPLAAAARRVLAGDVRARLTQPPFDASAMDGFAVRAADASAGAKLKLIGESAAGHAFPGEVGPGEAVRIYTGAPVPAGSDAVLIQENAEDAGAEIFVKAAAHESDNIRRAGNDFNAGETLLFAGDVLNPRALLLAAAMNYAQLPCRRKPVVAILSTGDELVAPGDTPRPDQIVGSVSYGVSAMVEDFGAEARVLTPAGDSVASLDASLNEVSGADILFTIGGASVGKHDIVRQRLEARGLDLDFWKIAMRPGKPFMHGHLGETRVLGAPGNPVAAMICARLFLVPLIAVMLGKQHDTFDMRPAISQRGLEANGPRLHFMRATSMISPDGAFHVTALPSQDSSLMRALREADCFIVRPPHAPAAASGASVDILPIDF